MICGPCREAADVLSGKDELVLRATSILLDPWTGHPLCKGGTWCDCGHQPIQRRIPK